MPLQDLNGKMKLRDAWPKVKANDEYLEQKIQGQEVVLNVHIDSAAAHVSQNISYNGAVDGALNVKDALDLTDERISGIVAAAGDSNAEIVDARFSSSKGQTFPVLTDRLGDIESDIAGLKGNMMLASYYGVDASIGNNDATGILNNLFAAAKSKGKKYIFFDVAHTYQVSGELTGARDLILIGDGATIKSSILDNYYIQICNNLESYRGKYNTVVATEKMFDAVWAAMQFTKEVNVCIWGDSISTSGSDVLNISYNNGNTGVNENAPNALTLGDSYYDRLIDMLTTKFPDVTFNFYNRAIGGSSIQQWQDQQTFNGVTKAWVDHIKDTNADLLIIGWGMNTNLSLAKEFIYCMDQINSYIDNNFTVKPSISWVTTPRPTMSLEDQWGTYDSQLSRDVAAYGARMFGRSKGHYIIDVAKVSNLKRTGKAFDNPIMEELAVNDTDISAIVSGNYTKTGTDYILDAVVEKVSFDVQLTDFVIEFEFNPAAVADASDNLWFAYNMVDTYESVILFQPKLGGVARIENYSRYMDSAHWGQTKSYTDSVSWDDGTYRMIRIEKRGDILDVFVNSNRVLRDRSVLNNLPGKIEIRKQVGATGTYTLRNFKLYQGTYRHYLPILTEREMWGQHQDGDYVTKPEFGGNGVNHPSTIGLQEVYCAALREFVDDLADIRNRATLDRSLMPMVQKITAWETAGAAPTTTSGANLRFFNAAKTDFPKVVTLQKSDGSYMKFRPDVNDFNVGAISLLDGEFGCYISAGYAQIVMAYTGALDAEHNFTSYRDVRV